MTLNLLNAVAECLAKRAEQKFTAREIADWMFQAFPAECEPKKSASIFIKNDADLVQQLVSEIDARRSTFQKRHPQIKATKGRLRQYYWTEKSDQTEIAEAERLAPHRT